MLAIHQGELLELLHSPGGHGVGRMKGACGLEVLRLRWGGGLLAVAQGWVVPATMRPSLLLCRLSVCVERAASLGQLKNPPGWIPGLSPPSPRAPHDRQA